MIDKMKKIFSKEVIIGGILVAVVLCGLAVVFQVGVFPFIQINPSQKAIVLITPVTTDISNSGISQTISVTTEATNIPGVVSTGMTVRISGTGNDGLRMRAAPGTDQDVLFIASEGEEFTIVDGPVIKDSLIWWKIQSMEDSQKIGWSVQDYLQAVQP
jgi:hypothetical protein